MAARGQLTVRPLTPGRWKDFEALFGERGACAGCWCMWWRRRGAAWREGQGDKNRKAMRALVADDGPPPGLLAYVGREAVGWMAVAPRADYVRLAHSRVLAPVDAAPVWSITCFFVRAGARGQGVSKALVTAAAAFAKKHGARELEAYPIDTRGRRGVGVFLYTGTLTMFEAAGFAEVARRSPTRPIVRRKV